MDIALVDLLTTLLTAALDRAERETALRDREHELERQNDQLDAFASVVSHDLRNPLNVAAGRVNLAREAHGSEHLDSAAEALDRSFALLDDLLTLAREGKRVDEAAAVDLADTVERCWGTVETHDVRLSVDTDMTIQADVSRLKQLLENLFRNSVEHSSTGSRPEADDSVEHNSTCDRTESGNSVEHGSATVTVGDLDDGTGFFVADDGPGIPEDEREQVFEPGYSTAEDGTGFGLNIVAEIAEAHDWSVRVRESETGGARFEISGVTVVDT